MSSPHHEHGTEDLCSTGTELYERAVRQGRLPTEDALAAPCLVDLGLLHPAVDDSARLEPVAPLLALHRLLRSSGERIANERQREARLTETFGSLMRIAGSPPNATDAPTVRLLTGTQRINQAITDAMADASEELITVQPRAGLTGERGQIADAASLGRDQAALDRGCRIRTLYPHTLRHFPIIAARCERLKGDVQIRTLDEVPDRLVLIDRSVAFVPAGEDGKLALEIRHPAIVAHLAVTFDRLWRLGTPMYPEAAPQPSRNGITPRQHAIAALLVEGHTDAVIADRLGMNIRTARVHIAKLAATLGSQSRAQLGFLIGRSGILDQED
ncbi:helix-turn-helix transcriptional regulator [Streptomyces hawaiiensis]|uniref:Helix-turn-helix transcriptional regulator n=1 Tax=Streptomyces hawaiiensis TaxID=67305 RepID=A0A6G5RGE9_9ACTN|nr:helix-turn-helix transcriptional regulator [Streptomyces hawaiiensis]QCD57198.1 helix-turn-helix transcriptional regulator [Streptomyces hawaiiensis]